MQEIINKGRNESMSVQLNYFAKFGKVYLMDNHLAAFWCWCQMIDPMKDYRLVHIDRHNDLASTFVREAFYQYKTLKFSDLKIFDAMALTVNGEQLFRWDNFIELFNVFHPYTLREWEFVTPERLPKRYRHYKRISLKSWLNKPISDYDKIQATLKRSLPIILNLDIDALYTGGQRNVFNLNNTQFEAFAAKLEWYIYKADIVTIALSPECCGGWDNCITTFTRLNQRLNLGFDMMGI